LNVWGARRIRTKIKGHPLELEYKSENFRIEIPYTYEAGIA